MTNAYAHRRVFVTGATGLIGSHLTAALLDLGATVDALVIPNDDHDSMLHRSGRLQDIRVHIGRLEESRSVENALAEARPEIVFHLGAQTQVRVARENPAATFAANVAGTWHVLDASRKLSDTPRAVIVASSDKAYGRSDNLPYVENHPLAGNEPYEVSKSITDLLAQTYAASYQLPTRIARCGNVYGSGDRNWDRIVPGTIRSLLRGERPVIRSDGTPIRDYVHVTDVVNAYLLLGQEPIAPGTAYNLSSGERKTVLEIVEMIGQAVGISIPPDVRGDAPGELAAQYLDATKANRELGWHASRRLAESLPEIVAWYREVIG